MDKINQSLYSSKQGEQEKKERKLSNLQLLNKHPPYQSIFKYVILKIEKICKVLQNKSLALKNL